jgi:large subunit ribosomal protein L24
MNPRGTRIFGPVARGYAKKFEDLCSRQRFEPTAKGTRWCWQEKGQRQGIAVTAKHQAMLRAEMIKRHPEEPENPQGAIVQREGTIHISNLMKAESFAARASKRTPAAPPA